MADRPALEEIEITPEMIEAGVRAWGKLGRGDFDLLDRSEFVDLILRAALDAHNFSSPTR